MKPVFFASAALLAVGTAASSIPTREFSETLSIDNKHDWLTSEYSKYGAYGHLTACSSFVPVCYFGKEGSDLDLPF